MRRPLALAVATLALVPVLAACGGDGGRLTIYSGRTRELVGPLLERFSEDTGIAIDVRYGDSADLALLIEQEGDRSPADVFLSQSPGPLAFLADNDRLTALPEDVLGLVDTDFEGDDGRWVGLSGRVRALVYNTEEVDEADLPASVFDMTDPRFRGQVALAPTNGSFQDFVTAMRVEVGDERAAEWLDGMEANDSPTYANNVAIVQAVARGEVPMGLVNHYYAEQHLAEDPDAPVANHFFADGDLGALLLVAGTGVVEGTDRGDDAQRFVEYLLSEDSQRYFADETFEYPLVEGVEPAGDLRPLADIPTPPFRLDDLGGGLERTQELIADSGIET